MRLSPLVRGVPGARALPWVVAWTSCLLDCAVGGWVWWDLITDPRGEQAVTLHLNNGEAA